MRTILTVLILAGLSATLSLAADAQAGKAVYDRSCKGCHGPDGAGNAAVAKMMKVEMKDLKLSDVQAMSDDDIKKVVMDGKGKMKPISSVTGANLDNVAAYVKSLKK